MSDTLSRVQLLIARGAVQISNHGYDELSDDDIIVDETLDGVQNAHLVEDYPDAPHGPCVLVLQKDAQGRPIHVVWGIASDSESPAVMITAYRPDPKRWSSDFLDRKRRT